MKVSELISAQVRLEKTDGGKKGKNESPIDLLARNRKGFANDSVNVNKNIQPELLRIKELERNYLKNSVSLNGFKVINETIGQFEKLGFNEPKWNDLSRELHGVVQSTMFEGESVISYLSTSVSDEKSLYTLKGNLASEIKNLQNQLYSERKQLANYLVKQENLSVVSSFSATDTLNKVISVLNNENSQNIHSGFSNIAQLLKV